MSGVQNFINSLQVKLFRLLATSFNNSAMFSVRNPFQLVFSNIAYSKVCFEVCKIHLPFFHIIDPYY